MRELWKITIESTFWLLGSFLPPHPCDNELHKEHHDGKDDQDRGKGFHWVTLSARAMASASVNFSGKR